MPSTKEKRKRSAKKERARARKEGWMNARTADKYVLYERSVQEPEAEVEFILQVWRERRNRAPKLVREDFCGTAISACQWVKSGDDHTAIGVDLDETVLEVARRRIAERLDEQQQSRIRLVQDDVLTVETEPVDSVLAMNFSYFLFKTRENLRAYFQNVRRSLADDGLFILDAYGGSEAFEELKEPRDCDGFTYVWDQAYYNPITGDAVNHIHFKFPDGSQMKKAFTYEWRLWTLPEIQELLKEAGFSEVAVYWEGTDEETDEGNGEFLATREGEACAGWIAYIVAQT